MTPAAVAVIRAGALRNNLRKVREAAPGCRILAVIKANAYGHGLVAVATILEGADGFAVARIEEAVRLREAGITKRLVVLGGFVGREEATLCAALRLDCVIHSIEQVHVLESLAELPPMDLWIKLDTGMGRLGLQPETLPVVHERLQSCSAGRGALRLMTHLACADEPGSASTSRQLEIFRRAAQNWRSDLSVANSAAVVQWPAAIEGLGVDRGRTWIRPGLMLYGISPVATISSSSLGLQAAMSFETRLIAIKRLQAGQRVGYGGDWQARRESLVGIAAAGYADGYPWHRSVDTPVLVNNTLAPVIGRVSMDMITIDLTGRSECRPGDPVILWGDTPAVEDVARRAGTISYELLAAVSPRVMRQIED